MTTQWISIRLPQWQIQLQKKKKCSFIQEVSLHINLTIEELDCSISKAPPLALWVMGKV